MKKIMVFILISLVGMSCGGATTEKNKTATEEENSDSTLAKPLKITDNFGNFKEWYPGHKQLKQEGRKDKEGKREGIWKYYSRSGVELSICYYVNGKKDGHTVVRYKNGRVHYVGEYDNGKPIGTWKFYDKQGNLTNTKNYD